MRIVPAGYRWIRILRAVCTDSHSRSPHVSDRRAATGDRKQQHKQPPSPPPTPPFHTLRVEGFRDHTVVIGTAATAGRKAAPYQTVTHALHKPLLFTSPGTRRPTPVHHLMEKQRAAASPRPLHPPAHPSVPPHPHPHPPLQPTSMRGIKDATKVQWIMGGKLIPPRGANRTATKPKRQDTCQSLTTLPTARPNRKAVPAAGSNSCSIAAAFMAVDSPIPIRPIRTDSKHSSST